VNWQEFLARHHVGDVIEGVVTKELPFGSFVESDGFTGLASRQSWPVGTRVSVRILRSTRRTSGSAWRRPEQALIRGKTKA
jgi:small subunit ribosomal protein S1